MPAGRAGRDLHLFGFVKTVDPWGTAIKIQEYLSIYGLESLSGLRFGFSIWLCGAELMMGLMLLFKVRIRLISIFALASMIFFTVLTFLSATWLPVEDCGCFGDAVKLTPWETFAKNLVLLPLSVVVWCATAATVSSPSRRRRWDAPCSSSPWPWGWASTAMRICR